MYALTQAVLVHRTWPTQQTKKPITAKYTLAGLQRTIVFCEVSRIYCKLCLLYCCIRGVYIALKNSSIWCFSSLETHIIHPSEDTPRQYLCIPS